MKKIIGSLFAILFLAIMMNCSSVQVKNHSLQRQWMLVSFGDFARDELVKNKAEVNLTANKENGKIRGTAYMGCNRMFFNSEFKDDGKVKISGVGSTMMACQNQELETSFKEKFEKMKKYTIEGHFLTLSDENGNAMKFVAADWD